MAFEKDTKNRSKKPVKIYKNQNMISTVSISSG